MRKRTRRFSALAGLLLLPGLATSEIAAQEGLPAGGIEMTLESALAEAMGRSPLLMQSLNSVESARQTRRTAVGAFLPSLSVSSGTSRSGSLRYDSNTDRFVQGSGESYSAGISTGLDLFTGFRRGAEIDAADADIESAEVGFEDQRFQVALQTKSLFYQALRETELLDVARSRLLTAEESLDNTRRRTQVGGGTRSDTLRARLEVQNARQAILTAEAGVRNARLALGRQVGVEVPVIPVPPSDLDPTPLPFGEEELFRMAEEVSPSVRAAEASVRAAGAQVRSSRSSYLPALRVGGNYNWSNNEFDFATGNTGWSANLSLSYNVFNGFNREAGVVRASNAERLARSQEQDARLAARVQADAAYNALRTAEAGIALAEESLLVAEEDLRLIQQRYDLGVATILDLITSQVAVDQARTDLVTARYDYAEARARLEALLGVEL